MKKDSVKNRFTLDEFWKMFASSKQKFDHKNPVVVSVPATFSEDPEVEITVVDSNQEGLKKVVAKAYHDQTNLNGSTIKPEVFLEKSESLKNRPILANIVENEDGSLDFGSHDFDVEITDDGDTKVIYQEKMVGIITDYHFEYDTEASVNRAVVEGFMYEEYSADAIKILANRGNVDCSVELVIRDFHYDEANSSLSLDDYYVSGLTLLGAEHLPGMAGSSISSFEGELPRKSAPEDEDGPAPSTKKAEPKTVDIEPESAPEVKPVEKSGPEMPVEANEPTEVSESPETEQAEPENTMDIEFVVLKVLAEANQDYEDLQWVLVNESDFVFSYEGSYFMGIYKENEITGIEKAAVISQSSLDSLMASLEAKDSQIIELQEKLKGFVDAEESARKEEALNDELYQDYLNEDAFVEVINQKETLDSAQFSAKLALAFAQVKREEKQSLKTNKKVFALPNKAKGKVLTEKEERYGRIFAEKLTGKEK